MQPSPATGSNVGAVQCLGVERCWVEGSLVALLLCWMRAQVESPTP